LLFALGGGVGVGTGGSVEGELAAVGDDEGFILLGHDDSVSFRALIFDAAQKQQQVLRCAQDDNF
jgi:hypothetical protein